MTSPHSVQSDMMAQPVQTAQQRCGGMTPIFNGEATMRVPAHFTRWDVHDIMARLQTAKSAQPSNNKPTGPNSSLVADTAFTSDDNEAFILGSMTEHVWPTGSMEPLLQRTRQSLARLLPEMRNTDISSRPIHNDMASNSARSLQVGILRCLFKTLGRSWYYFTLLLPVRGKAASLAMLATTDHTITRAMQFQSIVDSITVNATKPRACAPTHTAFVRRST